MESGKDKLEVASPFENASEETLANTPRRKPSRNGGIAIGVVLLLGLVYWASTIAGDPFRTLPSFPISKYFDQPRSLAGVEFQIDLRVDADLGWEKEAGRLLVFNTLEGKGEKLAILIPPQLADTIFDKNQAYRIALEVHEGGLIRANLLKKL